MVLRLVLGLVDTFIVSLEVQQQ